MLLFQIIYVLGPQLIGWVSFLFILILMLKAWRRTSNKGFLLLAIIAALGEIHFLAMKFGGSLFPVMSGVNRAALHSWISALLGLAGILAWWLLNKQLGAGKSSCDRE